VFSEKYEKGNKLMDELKITPPTKIYVAIECCDSVDLYCVGFDTSKEKLLDKIINQRSIGAEEEEFEIVPGDLERTLENANEATSQHGTWISVECLDLASLPEFRPTPKIVGVKKQEAPISPWLQLLFALFIGGWTAFWWHIFNGSSVIIEYALVATVATLLSYVVVLLFSWRKHRNA
jgi:hypothetical protein